MFPQHQAGRPSSPSPRSRSSYLGSEYYSDYPRSDLYSSYTSRSSQHDGYYQPRSRMRPSQPAVPRYHYYRSIATSPRAPIPKTPRRFPVMGPPTSNSTSESHISKTQIPTIAGVLSNLYQDVLRFFGHLMEYSLTTKIIACSITIILAAPIIYQLFDTLIMALVHVITIFTPLKYILPLTPDHPSPPHPDDIAAAAVKASLTAMEVGGVLPPQVRDAITAAAAQPATENEPFYTWLSTTTLFTILSTSSVRNLLIYWISRPLHIKGNQEPAFPEEARPSRLSHASPYWMTILYFTTRPGILWGVFRHGFLVSAVFCGVDSFSLGEFVTFLGPILGKGLPAVAEIYLFFVGLVWLVNRWGLVTSIASDITGKGQQIGEMLRLSWGAWLGVIVWGARVEGVVLVGFVVICLIVRSMWESLWESMVGWWLIMTSGTLMVLADWLFDWAGGSFRGVSEVVVDYPALRNATVVSIAKACRIP